MTTRHRLLLYGLPAGLLALSAGALLLWLLAPRTPHTAITRENFERIQVGLTKAEVEEISAAHHGTS